MKYLILILTMLLPTLAQAGMLDPVPGDKSIVVLSAIFGSLPVFPTQLPDAFGNVIATLNGVALLLGGIFAAYTIIAGTLGTAHDGEMLGKKFSSMWVPLRTALGTAFVLPILSGSYCVAQAIVAWFIIQGVGAADTVWTSFTSAESMRNVAGVGIQEPNVKKLGAQAFLNFVCLESMKKSSQLPESEILGGKNSSFGLTTKESSLKKTISFGDKNENNGFLRNSCGEITINKYQAPTVQNSGGVVSGLFNLTTAIDRSRDIVAKHEVQLNILLGKLQQGASLLVETEKPIDPKIIDNAIVEYEKEIRLSAAQAIQNTAPFNEVSEMAKTDGWMMAGAYFTKISNIIDMTNRSVAAIPEITGPNSQISSTYEDQYALTIKPMIRTLQDSIATGQFAIGNIQGGSNNSFMDNLKSFVTSGFDMNVMLKSIYTNSAKFVIDDKENPLMAMKRLGNWLLGFATAGWGASVMVMSTTPVGVAPGPALAIAITGLMICVPSWIAGATLSYLLPMLPFMIWFGLFTAWVSSCVMAILAAPLWAVMHLHPEGHDLAGKGSNGYNLMIITTLRPMLSVFGFIASIITLQVLGTLLNKVFADVFIANVGEDSGFIMLFIGIIASAIIYIFILYALIKNTFGAIHNVPDQMLEWFTGSSNNMLGNAAEKMGSNIGIAMGQQLSSTTQNAASEHKNLASNIASKEEQNKQRFENQDMKNINIMGNALGQTGTESQDSKPAIEGSTSFKDVASQVANGVKEVGNQINDNVSNQSSNTDGQVSLAKDSGSDSFSSMDNKSSAQTE